MEHRIESMKADIADREERLMTKQMLSRSLVDDPQTVEARLRAAGYSRKGEVAVTVRPR